MFNPKRMLKKIANPAAKAARKSVPAPAPEGDEFSRLRRQVDSAFKKAAKGAVAENDERGLPTHGAVRGKLVVRAPGKRRKPAVA